MLPEDQKDQAAIDALYNDDMVRFVWLDAMTNVLCPSCKLWDTGHGVNMMREAVSMMGGYGITEDCPDSFFRSGPTVSLKRHMKAPKLCSAAISA